MNEIESSRIEIKSRNLALRLFESWVRQRQDRPSLKIPKDAEELKIMGKENFVNQLAKPRENQLAQIKEVSKEMATADVVALLVMMEFPQLEISALLHKLSAQLMRDPDAVYFSKVNQSDNCGCGCGCGCAVMRNLPWDEQIMAHLEVKPFSIDPFNDVGLAPKERDSLLIKDFLQSYGALSRAVTQHVNERYLNIGETFG